MSFQNFYGFLFSNDASSLAARMLTAIFRAVTKLYTARTSTYKKIRSCSCSKFDHFGSKIPDFFLCIFAAADGRPIQKSMRIHTDDSFECSGLRFEVAEFLFRKTGFNTFILPLAGNLCKIVTRKLTSETIGQGNLSSEISSPFGIDHIKLTLAI